MFARRDALPRPIIPRPPSPLRSARTGRQPRGGEATRARPLVPRVRGARRKPDHLGVRGCIWRKSSNGKPTACPGLNGESQPGRSGGARARRAPSTRAPVILLEAPILPTLLRLAWPNIAVRLVMASTGLIETWWVSRLGTDALAGIALVFPLYMMMQMLSAGAMGGGISSAIARAPRRGAATPMRTRLYCMRSSSTWRSESCVRPWCWRLVRCCTGQWAEKGHR